MIELHCSESPFKGFFRVTIAAYSFAFVNE